MLCAATALAAVAGGAAGVLALHEAEKLLPCALMMSAASFLYITLFGLLPELIAHASTSGARWRAVLSVAAGAALSVLLLGPGHDHQGDHAHLHQHETHVYSELGETEHP